MDAATEAEGEVFSAEERVVYAAESGSERRKEAPGLRLLHFNDGG